MISNQIYKYFVVQFIYITFQNLQEKNFKLF